MYSTLLLIGCGSAGAVATYLLQQFGCTVVVASCIVGLVGAGIGHLFSDAHLAAVIFAGSFVGMTGLKVAPLYQVGIAGAVAGLVYQLSLQLFPGYGGRLGTVAFISCASAFAVLRFLARFF